MLIIPEGQDHERHQKGTEWCIFAMDYIPIIIYVDSINNCNYYFTGFRVPKLQLGALADKDDEV